MRVMIMAKETGNCEADAQPEPPTPEQMAAYAQFNEELVRAGIVLGEGRLMPSSTAVRMDFSGEKPSVTDGPFTEAKELVAGYWLWEVRSMEEAIEWMKRAPFHGGQFEIRQLMEFPERD